MEGEGRSSKSFLGDNLPVLGCPVPLLVLGCCILPKLLLLLGSCILLVCLPLLTGCFLSVPLPSWFILPRLLLLLGNWILLVFPPVPGRRILPAPLPTAGLAPGPTLLLLARGPTLGVWVTVCSVVSPPLTACIWSAGGPGLPSAGRGTCQWQTCATAGEGGAVLYCCRRSSSALVHCIFKTKLKIVSFAEMLS